jgi:hypothetical protein
MLLAWEQRNKPVEQNRGLANRSNYYTTKLFCCVGIRVVFSTDIAGLIRYQSDIYIEYKGIVTLYLSPFI